MLLSKSITIVIKSNRNYVCLQAIVHSFGLSDKDYKFGVTRVFFRPGKYSEFDTMMKSDPENLKSIVDAVLSWLVKSRWRKSIFAVLSIIKCKLIIWDWWHHSTLPLMTVFMNHNSLSLCRTQMKLFHIFCIFRTTRANYRKLN